MNKEKLLYIWHTATTAFVIIASIHLIWGVYLQRGAVNEGVEGYVRIYTDGGPAGGIRAYAKMDIETTENNPYSNSKIYHVTSLKADKWQEVDDLCRISDHTGTECTVDKTLNVFLELDRQPEFNYGSIPEA